VKDEFGNDVEWNIEMNATSDRIKGDIISSLAAQEIIEYVLRLLKTAAVTLLTLQLPERFIKRCSL
jgi:hypothetical protein